MEDVEEAQMSIAEDFASQKFVRANADGSNAWTRESLGTMNIKLNITVQENNVHIAESKIRCIKELARGIHKTSPFRLPVKVNTVLNIDEQT